jgi:hypothetical protein
VPEKNEPVKRSPSASSLGNSQKTSFRSKNGQKSSEPKRLPEMTTKEIMTISEKLLTKLKETMVNLSKKNAAE